MSDWRVEMAELVSAEEFLDFFAVEYDPAVVRVNRLHILQRFHDYIESGDGSIEAHRDALRRAYDDFVCSDARTQKALKVFRREGPQVAVVSLSQLRRRNETAL